MIYPQKYANRWVKNLWKESGIRIVKPHDITLMRTMENGVRVGIPVLLENAGETFEPALTPILNKSITRAGTRLTMHIGDQDVDYSEDFSLHITTTLPNPHYTPEISNATTIINFIVIPAGLDEQLLAETVCIERPELEAQRDSLIVQAAKDADDTSKVEDDIFKLLSSVTGSILDNESVTQALDKSKEIAGEIKKRVQETKETTALINSTRNQYLNVPRRGSFIYFVIAYMANEDPMYQFSLTFFTNLFSKCIKECQKQKAPLPEGVATSAEATALHVNLLVDVITKTQIFSFIITAQVARDRGIISTSKWRLFLLGTSSIVSTGSDEEEGGNKPSKIFSDLQKTEFIKDEQQTLISELEKIVVSKSGPGNTTKQTLPLEGIKFSIAQHGTQQWEEYINLPNPEDQ
ncbi:MAG: putative dynein heavy chain [Streblomastix strix]|uniref:Putative dynein heavy chain n=1 Tax=Streblomastix strix TaxID=222440 RepID=A0A5J4U6N9_9EUKA|nr:MAG: putative dynein heavy chain [Streblomastix strix]